MTLVDDIRRALQAAAQPERAPAQQAYMKSSMPFLGIRLPEVRRLARTLGAGESDAAALGAAARTLWDEASHREERYAAMALLALPPLRGARESLPLIEHMVRTGQWWDITDELSGRVRDLLVAHPEQIAPVIRAWARDADLWIRRVAILSQLTRRSGFDVQLFTDVIVPNLADSEFFIRKAIGWALRDRARVDPDGVRAFVDERGVTGLSRREALKRL
ncbi:MULTISPECIES: DNA alkylation repair protein [Microbacterium]|uniref:DNA alkylation repair protein n=1 Tax=Microbacterium TaxID=33882 RepID=UPI000E76DC72|nr:MULTISPECIES: DNA alkylation repair protein [Microbacterium]RKE63376.1 3-methyladenine DNA glycosylase AlkD [Microbacterium sp. AG238]WJM16982.1 DNA alkylation repair protein [Microbacterium arborescens]